MADYQIRTYVDSEHAGIDSMTVTPKMGWTDMNGTSGSISNCYIQFNNDGKGATRKQTVRVNSNPSWTITWDKNNCMTVTMNNKVDVTAPTAGVKNPLTFHMRIRNKKNGAIAADFDYSPNKSGTLKSGIVPATHKFTLEPGQTMLTVDMLWMASWSVGYGGEGQNNIYSDYASYGVQIKNTRQWIYDAPTISSSSCKATSSVGGSFTIDADFGAVRPNAGGTVTIDIYKDSARTNLAKSVTVNSNTQKYSGTTEVTGLQPNTRYYVRYTASNGDKTATSTCEFVTVATNMLSSATSTSSTSGSVKLVVTNGGGVYAPSTVVQYKKCDDSTWKDALTSPTKASITVNLNDLEENTCYDVRAVTTTTAGSYTGNTVTFSTPSKQLAQAKFTTVDQKTQSDGYFVTADVCYSYETPLTPAKVRTYFRMKGEEYWQFIDESTFTSKTGTKCLTLKDLFPNFVEYEMYLETETDDGTWKSDNFAFQTPLMEVPYNYTCDNLEYLVDLLCQAIKPLEQGNKTIYANPTTKATCDPYSENPTLATLWSRLLRLYHGMACIICEMWFIEAGDPDQYYTGEAGWVTISKKVEEGADTLVSSKAVKDYIAEEVEKVWHYKGDVTYIVNTKSELPSGALGESAITASDSKRYTYSGGWKEDTSFKPVDFEVYHVVKASKSTFGNVREGSAYYYFEGTWNLMDANTEHMDARLTEIENTKIVQKQGETEEEPKIMLVPENFNYSTLPSGRVICYVIEGSAQGPSFSPFEPIELSPTDTELTLGIINNGGTQVSLSLSAEGASTSTDLVLNKDYVVENNIVKVTNTELLQKLYEDLKTCDWFFRETVRGVNGEQLSVRLFVTSVLPGPAFAAVDPLEVHPTDETLVLGQIEERSTHVRLMLRNQENSNEIELTKDTHYTVINGEVKIINFNFIPSFYEEFYNGQYAFVEEVRGENGVTANYEMPIIALDPPLPEASFAAVVPLEVRENDMMLKLGQIMDGGKHVSLTMTIAGVTHTLSTPDNYVVSNDEVILMDMSWIVNNWTELLMGECYFTETIVGMNGTEVITTLPIVALELDGPEFRFNEQFEIEAWAEQFEIGALLAGSEHVKLVMHIGTTDKELNPGEEIDVIGNFIYISDEFLPEFISTSEKNNVTFTETVRGMNGKTKDFISEKVVIVNPGPNFTPADNVLFESGEGRVFIGTVLDYGVVTGVAVVQNEDTSSAKWHLAESGDYTVGDDGSVDVLNNIVSEAYLSQGGSQNYSIAVRVQGRNGNVEVFFVPFSSTYNPLPFIKEDPVIIRLGEDVKLGTITNGATFNKLQFTFPLTITISDNYYVKDDGSVMVTYENYHRSYYTSMATGNYYYTVYVNDKDGALKGYSLTNYKVETGATFENMLLETPISTDNDIFLGYVAAPNSISVKNVTFPDHIGAQAFVVNYNEIWLKAGSSFDFGDVVARVEYGNGTIENYNLRHEEYSEDVFIPVNNGEIEYHHGEETTIGYVHSVFGGEVIRSISYSYASSSAPLGITPLTYYGNRLYVEDDTYNYFEQVAEGSSVTFKFTATLDGGGQVTGTFTLNCKEPVYKLKNKVIDLSPEPGSSNSAVTTSDVEIGTVANGFKMLCVYVNEGDGTGIKKSGNGCFDVVDGKIIAFKYYIDQLLKKSTQCKGIQVWLTLVNGKGEKYIVKFMGVFPRFYTAASPVDLYIDEDDPSITFARINSTAQTSYRATCSDFKRGSIALMVPLSSDTHTYTSLDQGVKTTAYNTGYESVTAIDFTKYNGGYIDWDIDVANSLSLEPGGIMPFAPDLTTSTEPAKVQLKSAKYYIKGPGRK